MVDGMYIQGIASDDFDYDYEQPHSHFSEIDTKHSSCSVSTATKTKMSRLIYALTKDAARYSWNDYLDNLNISPDEYKEIKRFWAEFDIKPYI